jgi:nucleoside phosphorylase
MSRQPAGVTFGIITALAWESAAIRALTTDLRPEVVPHDPNRYHSGHFPSASPAHPHRVVITLLPKDGNKAASAAGTALIRSFPEVRALLMVGIAGGIPDVTVPERHVRLGDVVVATEGIVDYDHVRTTDGTHEIRRHVQGLSVELLRAANELRVGELAGERPWERWLTPGAGAAPAPFTRPDESADVLYRYGVRAAHPSRARTGHRAGLPKVHHAAIASADRLLRDEALRDELARRHRVAAVEMEASGVASGADLHGVSWFAVRGIADYCENAGKNDAWHPYASLAAAAYVRALLAHCRPAERDPAASTAAAAPPPSRLEQRMALVELMLAVPAVADERSRQVMVECLSPRISATIRRFASARLDVSEILATCLDFPGGVGELIAAIRSLAGDSHPVRRLVEALEPYRAG